MLADSPSMGGAQEQAIPMLQAIADEARTLGQAVGEAVVLATLGMAYALAGDIEQARRRAAQAWPLAREQDVAELLRDQGVLLAAFEGPHEAAARLLGFARRPGEAQAPIGWMNEARLLAKAAAHLDVALGTEALAGLRAEGAQLDTEAGLALLESVLLPTR